MNGFSYVFELFALLLGLAVAEMLGGFGQVLKLRARRARRGFEPAAPEDERGNPEVRIGWLVPLLGLLVTVDLATFWSMAWTARDVLEMNMLTVFCVLALIGGYYLVATQVFPDDPALWPDFDDWYRLQKRFVVLGVLAINLLSQAALMLLGAEPAEAPDRVAFRPTIIVASLLVLLNLPALVWLAFSKRERVDIGLIAFIVATQFFYAWAAVEFEGLE